MCNCNQKRQTLKSDGIQKRDLDAQMGMNQVRLIQKRALKFNGDVTGRIYSLKNENDITWVDKRDIPYLKNKRGIQILS